MQDGPPSPDRQDVDEPAILTEELKARTLELGADLVGVTRVDPHYIYESREVPHRFAFVFAMAMDLEEILQVPRVEANVEFLSVYERMSGVGVELAATIRALGYPARAHTLLDEGLAMLPHAYAAGLGELGRHGSLINGELGYCFRVGVVTTDLPLAEDSPRNDGIEDFCASCRMCTEYCPGDAISGERATVRGAERWIVDTERCAPYFAEHYACGICLQVCPFNAKAFDGMFRDEFTQTLRDIDPGELAESLTQTLPQPWTEISPPR